MCCRVPNNGLLRRCYIMGSLMTAGGVKMGGEEVLREYHTS